PSEAGWDDRDHEVGVQRAERGIASSFGRNDGAAADGPGRRAEKFYCRIQWKTESGWASGSSAGQEICVHGRRGHPIPTAFDRGGEPPGTLLAVVPAG